MKKKAVKLATASAIVASAFAATTGVSAAENKVNVDQLVKEAEKHAGALKWAISAEYTADGVNAPHAIYNLTKEANAAAKKAVAQTKGEEKVVYEERLRFVQQQIDRTQNYIDAITASDKVKAKTADLNKAVADKNIQQVISAHHALTAEVRKQAEILYRVYGKSTRDLILAQTKAPAEAAIEATKVDVTVQTHLNLAANAKAAQELEKASQQLAKADAWIGKASSNFKSILEENRKALGDNLSLVATGVERVNNNTVTVKVTKPAGVVLAADDFHFTNGLEVTAIKTVSADGQTYTLTTTEQAKGATYELVFQGNNTGYKFTTPPAQNDGKLTGEPVSYKQLNAGDDRVFKVDVSHINDSKYTGDVKVTVKSTTGNSKLTVLAGKANPVYTGSANEQSYVATVGIAGELLFTLSHNHRQVASDEVEIWVTLLDDNGATPKTIKLGNTSFYKHANNNDIVESELSGSKLYAHNKAEDYFVYSKDGSTRNALKYSYDSNDVFKIENRTVTLDQFEAALSNGDVIEVDDHSSIKTFHIVSNVSRVAIAPLNITTPDQVVRFDGQNYRVSGTGEAGYKVQLFADVNGNKAYDFGTDILVSEQKIGADGKWVVEAMTLAQNERNNLVAVQYASNDSARDNAGKAHHSDWAQVLEGPFQIVGVKAVDAVADKFFGIGDTLVFDFLHNAKPHEYDHQLKTAAGAKIEVQDTLGKKAVLTVKENTDTAIKTDVTVVNFERDPLFGFGTVNITSTTGITNQDNQVLNLSGTLSQNAFYAAPFSPSK